MTSAGTCPPATGGTGRGSIPPAAPAFGLTPRMRELLIYLSERERCPSYDEMRRAMGLASNERIFHMLNALEERGYIRRQRSRRGQRAKPRSIRVIRPLARPPIIIKGNRYRFIPVGRI